MRYALLILVALVITPSFASEQELIHQTVNAGKVIFESDEVTIVLLESDSWQKGENKVEVRVRNSASRRFAVRVKDGIVHSLGSNTLYSIDLTGSTTLTVESYDTRTSKPQTLAEVKIKL